MGVQRTLNFLSCISAPTSDSAKRRLKNQHCITIHQAYMFYWGWCLKIIDVSRCKGCFKLLVSSSYDENVITKFTDFSLLLLVSPSFPRSYLPVIGPCFMSCTKQAVGLASYNCKTFLLKTILSLFTKYLHSTKTSLFNLEFHDKEKKQQNKIFLPFMPPFFLQIFAGKATIGRFSLFCVFTNLARVLKLRITTHLSKCFKQVHLLYQTTL